MNILIHEGNLPKSQFTCNMRPEESISVSWIHWAEIVHNGHVYARVIVRGPEEEWQPKIEDMLRRLNHPDEHDQQILDDSAVAESKDLGEDE